MSVSHFCKAVTMIYIFSFFVFSSLSQLKAELMWENVEDAKIRYKKSLKKGERTIESNTDCNIISPSELFKNGSKMVDMVKRDYGLQRTKVVKLY
jgi:hypothetical protein